MRWLALALVGVTLALWASGLLTLTTLTLPLQHLATLAEARPLSAAALFLLAYVAVVTFSLPLASLLTLTGGALFGTLAGTFMVVAAATTGATLVFWLVKKGFGRALVQKAEANPRFKPLLNRLQAGAFWGLFILRVLPLFPFFLVNLAPALINMPTRHYVLATFFGIVPGTVVYTTIGNSFGKAVLNDPANLSLTTVLTPSLLLALVLLAVVSLATAYLARRFLAS